MLPAHIYVEKTAMKLLILEFWFTVVLRIYNHRRLTLKDSD
jgi:hypothetical protein